MIMVISLCLFIQLINLINVATLQLFYTRERCNLAVIIYSRTSQSCSYYILENVAMLQLFYILENVETLQLFYIITRKHRKVFFCSSTRTLKTKRYNIKRNTLFCVLERCNVFSYLSTRTLQRLLLFEYSNAATSFFIWVLERRNVFKKLIRVLERWKQKRHNIKS
jgi:hypothetical protein